MTTYTLEERLDCLCSMKAKLYDYRHVINVEDGEPLTDMVQNEINLICEILEERELLHY